MCVNVRRTKSLRVDCDKVLKTRVSKIKQKINCCEWQSREKTGRDGQFRTSSPFTTGHKQGTISSSDDMGKFIQELIM